jgi:nitrite reductase/ring-hydroxylating ferredoxin subunit
MTERPESDVQLPLELGDWRPLCRLEEIQDGTSRGFPPAQGGFTGLMAIRQADAVYVYVNSCPHIGTPLDWVQHRFLSADGRRIVCATHGAEFGIADGVCIRGPCAGDRLDPVPVEIRDGVIYVPHDAGL